MKQFFILNAIFIFFTLFSGCDEERIPETRLTVDKTELNFVAGVTSLTFNVEASADWYSDADEIEPASNVEAAIARDFIIMPSFGKADSKTTVTVTLDSEVTESYEIELKIIAAAGKKIETVKLKAFANKP